MAGAGWLIEVTVDRLQQAMASGEATSVRIVLGYLERIAQYDKDGPRLNSVLEINPDAVQIAMALDHERSTRGPRGPLHGIPVLLKDNIDTGDRMHTSAGSLALKDSFAREDSSVAARLREAGAVLMGKANMTEWANYLAERMPGGYSSRGGQVLNPYGPGKFPPRGSSTGSGVSVAANLVTLAVGTDTSASVLSPAHANCVVGIRPTVGSVGRRGIIPISISWDTAGPLARTVRDAAILFGAMTGVDERDPVTLTGAGRTHKDYTQFLDKEGLRGARIGIPRDVYQKAGAEHVAVMEKAIEAIRGLGAEVIDPVALPAAKENLNFAPMTYEFKPAINAYLSGLSPGLPARTLRELIMFNDSDPERMLKYGQARFTESEMTSGTLTEPEYINAKAVDLSFSKERGIDAAMDGSGLDALLMPGPVCCDLSARVGYPSVCVPGGFTPSGQPMGVTFTGRAYTEPLLLKFAYAFEQATLFRRPPAFPAAS